MRNVLLFFMFICFAGCLNPKISDSEKETILGEDITTFAERIEVIEVETGWRGGVYPFVRIKFKNISAKPITESIIIKYRFLNGDEVLSESFTYLHSSSDVEWDKGIVKTEYIESLNGYKYGWDGTDVTFKICYDDNSLIWEGHIKNKAYL